MHEGVCAMFYIHIICVQMQSKRKRFWSETIADDEDTVNDAVNLKLFHDIQRALSRLVSEAEQPIDNATTNVAESWMHIRMNGKVINPSQSGSWQHRCMGAGSLQQNLGKQWEPATWKEMTALIPNKEFTDCAKRASDCLANDKKRGMMSKPIDVIHGQRGQPFLGTMEGSHLRKSTAWNS